MGSYRDVYANMGPLLAAHGDIFGEDGMSLSMHLNPADSSKLRSLIESTFARPELGAMGMSAKGPTTSEAGGVSLADYELSFDMKKLAAMTGANAEMNEMMPATMEMIFGKGGTMPLRLAFKGDRAAFVIGSKNRDSAARSLEATEGSLAPASKLALQRVVACNPMFVERIDVVPMMRSVMSMMQANDKSMMRPNVPDNASAEMVVFGGVRGSEWRAGLSFDVVGFAKMMKAMMPR
jgi:hypothetical protein